MAPLAIRAIDPEVEIFSAQPLSRALYPRTTPPAEPNIFLKIFRSIASLSVISAYLSSIAQAWHWIHHRHQINTAIAQAKLDQEFLQEQNAMWRRKESLAEKRARRFIAIENPGLFLRVYVLKESVGSLERRHMLALLRKYRPDVYEWWTQHGGESLEDDGKGEAPTENIEKAAEDVV